MEAIEQAYQSWLPNRSEKTVIVDKLEIDFARMKMKKRKGEVIRCFLVDLFQYFP